MHDGQATDRPSVDQEARWISFNDLAALRGISRASASKLVRRHGWRRQTDNQGHVLILVPAEALDRPSDSQGTRPWDSPADRPSLREQVLVVQIHPVPAMDTKVIPEGTNSDTVTVPEADAVVAAFETVKV